MHISRWNKGKERNSRSRNISTTISIKPDNFLTRRVRIDDCIGKYLDDVAKFISDEVISQEEARATGTRLGFWTSCNFLCVAHDLSQYNRDTLECALIA